MRHDHRSGRSGPGFALIELLAALAIGALLASLGWPLLARQRASAAVAAATNRTLAALLVARQKALATGLAVTVCPSPDTRRCGFGGGQWMVFENLPGGLDAVREAGENVLQQWQLPAGILADGTRGYAAYQPATRSASTLTFRFCHQTHPQLSRSVIVSQTGRPRVTRPNAASNLPVRRCEP
jgi:type IV fimbrial biogenesis protein FimT